MRKAQQEVRKMQEGVIVTLGRGKGSRSPGQKQWVPPARVGASAPVEDDRELRALWGTCPAWSSGRLCSQDSREGSPSRQWAPKRKATPSKGPWWSIRAQTCLLSPMSGNICAVALGVTKFRQRVPAVLPRSCCGAWEASELGPWGWRGHPRFQAHLPCQGPAGPVLSHGRAHRRSGPELSAALHGAGENRDRPAASQEGPLRTQGLGSAQRAS